MPSKAQIEFVFSPTDIFVFSFFVHPIIELEFNLALFLFTRWLVFFSRHNGWNISSAKTFWNVNERNSVDHLAFFFLSRYGSRHDSWRLKSQHSIGLGHWQSENTKNCQMSSPTIPYLLESTAPIGSSPPLPMWWQLMRKRWQISVGMDGCQK